MKKELYFWGHSSSNKKACLSNFFKCEFRDIGGTKFNFSEQCFMFYKALLFKDYEIANRILEETDVKEIKKLGRKVKNFNQEIWNKEKQNLMLEACYFKFSENEDLKEYLLSTGEAILVEASPFDRIWGIGFDASTAERNRANWGENLLGRVLMEVRHILKREDESGTKYFDFDDYLNYHRKFGDGIKLMRNVPYLENLEED